MNSAYPYSSIVSATKHTLNAYTLLNGVWQFYDDLNIPYEVLFSCLLYIIIILTTLTNYPVTQINNLSSSPRLSYTNIFFFNNVINTYYKQKLFNTIPGLNLLVESIAGVVKTAQPSISKPIVFRFEKKNGFIDQ